MLQASDPVEAIRLKAQRLYVVRRGEVISRANPMTATVSLGDAEHHVDFRHKLPD